ncbi:hypothetical protein [Roseomonas sp. BN140053]|uniref:hypothetical protein n=1 Tax=Roseomonas sp. BN140053 TaxID=3391898 RepID=UPI0039EA98BB
MSSESDSARLQRILATLPPDDALFLAQKVEPASLARARRLNERDEVIRSTRAFLPGLLAEAQARTLAQDLFRFLATDWTNRTDNAGDSYRDKLRRIATLNDGKSIKARQILNIFHHSRGCTYSS